MSASVKFTGLMELRAALQRLPEEMRAEAADLLKAKAEDAKNEIIAAYPEVFVESDTPAYRRNGDLRKGVVTEVLPGTSRFGARVAVKSRAKHAWLFENGTQTRKNSLGANRGAARPGRVFVPIMIRKRRELLDELKALVARAGFEVRE